MDAESRGLQITAVARRIVTNVEESVLGVALHMGLCFMLFANHYDMSFIGDVNRAQ